MFTNFIRKTDRLSECGDKDIRYDAIYLLINIYGAAKQCGKALDCINLLTPIKYCSEFAKSSGIGDGNTELYIQDEIDKLTYSEPSKDFHELTEHGQCYYMLDRLQNKRYDFIRNTDRFAAVVNTMKEYAK